MPFFAPPTEGFSPGGYAPAYTYRSAVSHPSAQTAKAYPGSDATAQLLSELDNLMLDCFQSDWDGHGAQAVSPEAYRIAQSLIRSLPAGFHRPVLSADPDGCVTFKWRTLPRRIVMVSVHPDYRIDFAALFGNEKLHGTKPFFDRIPEDICNLVRRVYQA